MPIVTTRPRLRLTAGLLAAALVASLVAFVGTASPAAATPDNYTPKEGVRFNNPLAGEQSRRNIIRHLIRTINSVPKKEEIRIASWNVRSDAIINALIRAHTRRQVSVRVVMDRLNANPSNPNFGVNRLEKALKVGNGKRKQSMKSFVRKCVSACRAARGIAHTKFYLFSEAGKTRNIVMFGSANATDLAASAQWNDLYTVRRDLTMYSQFDAVFQEMAHDRNLEQPYLGYATADNKIHTWFYPYKGVGTEQDPVLAELAKTRCQGSTINGGKTRIRIAMTSMHGERGILIAQRLMRMWNRGCDIKIVYAVFGNEVMSVFRNKGPRPMPFRQIAQDFSRDGVYDRYLHMKDMTISGHYDGAHRREGRLQRHRQLDGGGSGVRRGRREDLRRQAAAQVRQLDRLALRPPAEVQQRAARHDARHRGHGPRSGDGAQGHPVRPLRQDARRGRRRAAAGGPAAAGRADELVPPVVLSR